MDSSFAAFDPPFAGLDSTFAALDPTFAALDSTFAALDPTFAALDPSFAALATTCAALDPGQVATSAPERKLGQVSGGQGLRCFGERKYVVEGGGQAYPIFGVHLLCRIGNQSLANSKLALAKSFCLGQRWDMLICNFRLNYDSINSIAIS